MSKNRLTAKQKACIEYAENDRRMTRLFLDLDGEDFHGAIQGQTVLLVTAEQPELRDLYMRESEGSLTPAELTLLDSRLDQLDQVLVELYCEILMPVRGEQ